MKKEYIIRHKILAHLYSKIEFDDNHVPYLGKSRATLQELADAINVPIGDVVLYHHAIPDTQAICIKDADVHTMMIQRDGLDAFVDRYWLKQGRKEMNDSIYDVTKWIVPLLAFVVSVGSVIYTSVLSKETKSSISELEAKVSIANTEIIRQHDILNRLSENQAIGRMSERLRFVDSLILSTRKK